MNEVNNSEPKITINTLLAAVKFGLENLDAFGGDTKNFKPKNVTIINVDSISCEYYTNSGNSNDIKLEIGTIMSFIHGLLKEDLLGDFNLRYFVVSAYDQNDNQLLYAISSRENAALIGNGNSVEWLKATVFQENTPDYRLGLAKRMISEIENLLRHATKDILSKKFGINWWENGLDNKLGQNVKDTYNNQYGIITSDGNILIEYTYLLQLKKIIVTHWPLFDHLFDKKTDFEKLIEDLNVIRREEAHNRDITEKHIKDLDQIYILLLSKACISYPDFLPNYLIENWQLQIKKIMSDNYKTIFQEDEVMNESDQEIKLMKVITNNIHTIKYLEEKISLLESIIVPVQKKVIHEELLEVFKTYNVLQKRKLDISEKRKFDLVKGILEEIRNHELKMTNFSKKILTSES